MLEYLVTYQPINNKIRIGNKGDGGYVIVDGYNYDFYLSCGIANETSFDNEFIKLHPDLKGFGYDGTVDDPKTLPSNIKFIKKNINSFNSETTTNLINEIQPYSNIFLKIDIEGYEIPWLQNIELNDLKKFKQITMELHGLHDPQWCMIHKYHNPEWDFIEYNEHNMTNCLKKLAETHYLVHAHANNWGRIVTVNNIPIPSVIELTYLRKDEDAISGLNTLYLPDKLLDFPCKQNSEDINLNMWPFYYK